MSVYSAIRSRLIHSLAFKPLGVPLAALSGLAGATTLSRKVSLMCGYVPPLVEFTLPEYLAAAGPIVMHGAHGRDPVARSIWWGGGIAGYESPYPQLFAACSRDSRLVLDVGSFSGLYSMIAATTSPRAKVFAFDPFPPALELLRKNVHRNRLEDRIHVFPLGLSDFEGQADFFQPTTTTGLIESASTLKPTSQMDILEQSQVAVTTVDKFLAEHCPDLSVDLMKIDVENNEPQVLRGASRVLREHRPVVFLEVLPQADVDALDSIRAAEGYISAVLVPEGIRWEPRVEHMRGRHDHVFCPAEMRDWLRDAVKLAGFRAHS